MDQYRWKNRVLVLLAQPGDQQVEVQQQALASYQDGLAERDMVIFAVIGNDRVQAILGNAPPDAEAAALRARFDVPPDGTFTALLVGKDGGVKWRENRPAGQRELFDLIDAMPMRRSESRPAPSRS